MVENDISAGSRIERLSGNVNVCSYLSANAVDFVLLKVNKRLDVRQARQSVSAIARVSQPKRSRSSDNPRPPRRVKSAQVAYGRDLLRTLLLDSLC